MLDKAALRQQIKQQRAALPDPVQRSAAANLVGQLQHHADFINATHIAFYLAHGGEIDPGLLLSYAQADGKHCYLPVLAEDNSNHLYFAPFKADTPLTPNRYGILEPNCSTADYLPATELDLAFLPLVAFDEQGNRMGMGKGYYDRTFEFCLNGHSQPKLIGLAHSLQQVAQLDAQSWDVPLDAVVTERGIESFNR